MSARPQLHVTVVRHAETNSNLNHILQGHIGMLERVLYLSVKEICPILIFYSYFRYKVE